MQIHNQKIASYEVSCKIEFQFLALRTPLPNFFLYKISAKCCLVVCANTLLLNTRTLFDTMSFHLETLYYSVVNKKKTQSQK